MYIYIVVISLSKPPRKYIIFTLYYLYNWLIENFTFCCSFYILITFFNYILTSFFIDNNFTNVFFAFFYVFHVSLHLVFSASFLLIIKKH